MTKFIIMILIFIASMFVLGYVDFMNTPLINGVRLAMIAIAVISGFLIIVLAVNILDNK